MKSKKVKMCQTKDLSRMELSEDDIPDVDLYNVGILYGDVLGFCMDPLLSLYFEVSEEDATYLSLTGKYCMFVDEKTNGSKTNPLYSDMRLLYKFKNIKSFLGLRKW